MVVGRYIDIAVIWEDAGRWKLPPWLGLGLTVLLLLASSV